MFKIAVMGHGTVGSGVVELILQNKTEIIAKAGADIEVAYILDLRDFPGLSYSDKFTKSFDDILNDDEVSVVVEVMGGLNPAFDFVSRCLKAGKSVVTSNKELVAAKGAELLKIARQNNVNFLFEASVGGGIPVIRPMSQCLAANRISGVAGVLNGTTNYILTKMYSENVSFDDALQEAQSMGYAERDPSADIDGHDTCRKICILSALAYGHHIYPSQVSTTGIRNISSLDVEYAALLGREIKLVGRSRKTEDGMVECLVAPMMIKRDSPLAVAKDVFNAISVCGDAVGEVMFYGPGAGKMPTASAVVADIIDCVKHAGTRKYLFWNDSHDELITPAGKISDRFFVRVTSADTLAAEKAVADAALGAEFVKCDGAAASEIAFTTEKMTYDELNDRLGSLSAQLQPVSVIRFYE